MVLLALAIACDDGSGDTGGATGNFPPPPTTTGSTGTPPGLDGTWEASVDTYGGSSSTYYTTDSGTVVGDDFGGACLGTARLVIDTAATPAATGTLDCGTDYEVMALTGEVAGDVITGSSDGVDCAVGFSLTYSTSRDTWIGTLGVCDAEYGGWVFPVTLLRAGP